MKDILKESDSFPQRFVKADGENVDSDEEQLLLEYQTSIDEKQLEAHSSIKEKIDFTDKDDDGGELGRYEGMSILNCFYEITGLALPSMIGMICHSIS